MWNAVPGTVVTAPSINVLKNKFDKCKEVKYIYIRYMEAGT